MKDPDSKPSPPHPLALAIFILICVTVAYVVLEMISASYAAGAAQQSIFANLVSAAALLVIAVGVWRDYE